MATPDILLIILDTLRRDRLSIYGHPQATSPAFDRFAERSTLFERAVAPAQWTVPSHASMFTGLYPTTHQLTQADGRLSDNIPTLAEILSANGYHTAGFCNNPLVGVLDNGLTRGFVEFFNYAGAAPNRPRDMMRGTARRRLARQWRQFAMHVSQRFAHNDWLFRLSLHPLITPIWTRSVNYKGNTAHSVDDLVDYIKQHHAGGRHRPLFTFLNLMGGHMPYRPPKETLHRFAPEISKDKAAYRFMARWNADAARWASPTDPPLTAWERSVIDGFYNAEVAHQDTQLARLLHYLETSDALKDTMVIIAADHGEGHGDHDFFGHSFVVYQELVHVPLIIRYPEGFPPGERVQENVSTRRLFHTILDAAGIRPPLPADNPNADVDHLTLRRAGAESGVVFAEAIPPTTFLSVLKHRNPEAIEHLQLHHPRRGVYADAFKLAMVADDVEGLFHLEHDPQETRDLSGQHQAIVNDLQAKIDDFVQIAESRRVDSVRRVAGMNDEMLANLRALGYLQ